MNQRRIKPGWLTQADIDRKPLPPVSRRCASWREAYEYLKASPGGFLTMILTLAIFAAVMWGLWFFWTTSDAVISAIKG